MPYVYIHSPVYEALITSIQKHSEHSRSLESEGCSKIYSLMPAGVETSGGFEISWKIFNLLTPFSRSESGALM